MRLLALLLAVPIAVAGGTPAPSAPAPAPPGAVTPPAPGAETAPAGTTRPPLPPPKPADAREILDLGVKGTAPNGATVTADVRDAYLQGFPIVVEVGVANDTAAPITTPDLGARRHLVHFKLVSAEGKTEERYSTPPAFDTGGDWILAPKTRRTVLLEIPSSAALAPGNWALNVMVGDGAQALILPTQKMFIGPANPASGDVLWEPQIAAHSGSVIPWVQPVTGGFDLYLSQFAAGDTKQIVANHWLLRSPRLMDPVLPLVSAANARSRWVYWAGEANEVRTVRLEGAQAVGPVRSLGAPWPKIEFLARGVSDAKGGLEVPIWVPDPRGTGGGVRILCMGERGGVYFRTVADFDARPTVAESGVDAGGNLVLVLGHDKGLDVYRVDASAPEKLPATGHRASKAGDGWITAGAAFDVLPDKDGRAGGLSILALQLLPAVAPDGPSYRTLRVDLEGKAWETSPALPWLGPAGISHLLPAAYAPFHYVARDPSAGTLFGEATKAPVNLGKLPEASAWPNGAGWRLRWLAGDRVFTEKAVPTAP